MNRTPAGSAGALSRTNNPQPLLPTRGPPRGSHTPPPALTPSCLVSTSTATSRRLSEAQGQVPGWEVESHTCRWHALSPDAGGTRTDTIRRPPRPRHRAGLPGLRKSDRSGTQIPGSVTTCWTSPGGHLESGILMCSPNDSARARADTVMVGRESPGWLWGTSEKLRSSPHHQGGGRCL